LSSLGVLTQSCTGLMRPSHEAPAPGNYSHRIFDFDQEFDSRVE
jgi:hypothetical protein